MAAFQHFKRRSIIPLAGLGLVVYYFVVLAPLWRRAEGLNAPLQTAWQKLSTSLDQTNVTAIDFLHITNQLAETRHAIALLENAKQKLAGRLELSGAVRSKMNQARFENFDYSSDRSKQINETSMLAKTCQVIEIPLQIEMTGSAASLLKLLQSLPLRADEMRAAGLSEGLTNKAPLFIERLMMKKQGPDKPDEVRVSLRAVGFVLRE